MMLQPNAARSSNAGPGNAGLSLPTVRHSTEQATFCPFDRAWSLSYVASSVSHRQGATLRY